MDDFFKISAFTTLSVVRLLSNSGLGIGDDTYYKQEPKDK